MMMIAQRQVALSTFCDAVLLRRTAINVRVRTEDETCPSTRKILVQLRKTSEIQNRILGPRSCWPGTSLVQSTRSSVTGSIYVMVEALRKTTQKIRQDEARCIHNLFRSPPGDDAMSM